MSFGVFNMVERERKGGKVEFCKHISFEGCHLSGATQQQMVEKTSWKTGGVVCVSEGPAQDEGPDCVGVSGIPN
jgi:hypothetical protein